MLRREEAGIALQAMQEKKALSSRGRGRLRGFIELRRPWGFSPEARRPDPSSKATLWVKAQHEGALPPPCIVRKDPLGRKPPRVPQLEETPEMPPSSRGEGLLFLPGLESNHESSVKSEEDP